MLRSRTRGMALGGAAVLTALAAGPALAAGQVVAQAEASAITVTLGGQTEDSGTVRATHDGENETVSGSTAPALPLGGGQSSLSVGVLAQEATASLDGRRGISRACAGLAGDGGSVVEIGDTSCLVPGTNASLSLASLGDLGAVVGDLVGQLSSPDFSPEQLQGILDGLPAGAPSGAPDDSEAPGGDGGSGDSAPSTDESAPEESQAPLPEEIPSVGEQSQSPAPSSPSRPSEPSESGGADGVGGVADQLEGALTGSQGGPMPASRLVSALETGTPLDDLLGSEGNPLTPESLANLLNGEDSPFADALEGTPLADLGDLAGAGLELRLGAIEAVCRAEPGDATGTSTLTEVNLVATGVPGGDLVLASLPTNPEPNTKVVTGLDEVVALVTGALRTQLAEGLDGQLSPAIEGLDALEAALVDQALAQIAPQLAPLEENIVDITLNRQTFPEDGAIRVQALNARLLPAAEDFGAPTVADVTVGDVLCGPNGRVTPQAGPVPEIPTAVSAGENMTGGSASDDGGILFGAALALAGAGAVGGLVVRSRRA